VWIDWNQDEDFDDAGENVGCAYSTPEVTTFAITVPEDALEGPTRMRIRLKYFNADCGTPCGTTTYGEVEDYTVVINNTTISWLTVSPLSGTVPGQGTSPVTLTFDSGGLEEGDYYAQVKISSNDPDDPMVIVTCTLHVVNLVSVDLRVMLEGAFTGTGMHTTLNAAGLLPLDQPFNTMPWNYNGTEGVTAFANPDVTDWVLVELRQTAGEAGTATPATIIGRQAGFLLKDGAIVGKDGTSVLRYDVVISSNLYAVVYHRNHLGVMSAGPLVGGGGTYTLDFRPGLRGNITERNIAGDMGHAVGRRERGWKH
jgi:hypothetical protein